MTQYWITIYKDEKIVDNWLDWEEDLNLSAEEYLEQLDLTLYEDVDEIEVTAYGYDKDTAWLNLKENGGITW